MILTPSETTELRAYVDAHPSLRQSKARRALDTIDALRHQVTHAQRRAREAEARADAAETKLAALVEAADFLGPTWPSELVAWMGRGGKPDEATRAAVAGLQGLHDALRASRGPT